MKEKWERLLEALRKELRRKIPPHHWKHIQVWTKYWQLKEIIEKEEK